ncbi:MAG: hypothetical protein AMS22_01125 [Thiotrichales bacterium SG8_50]|nr:MAG: hypothetical protein AMS22_01125 [Thiotrichales bacterium SG8_50]
MPDPSVLLILVVAACAHGIFGFGFPLISTPLLVLTMDLPAAVLVTLIPTVSINLVSILSERHWREALRAFWPIPTFTVVGSFLGTQVLLSVDTEPLHLLLSLVLIAYLVSDRFTCAEHERRSPPWVMAGLGLGLGLLAGLVNIFAPLLVAYALYTRMNPVLMVATFNLSFITSKSGQIAGFLVNGAFTEQALAMTLWTLPPVLVSLWLGIRWRKRINTETYRSLLRYALWVIALFLVVDSVLRLGDHA